MSKVKPLPPVGTATEGICVMPPMIWADRDTGPDKPSDKPTEIFTIESVDGLMSRDELRFYDWSVGILEDAGVVGVLRNDFVYQASCLRGEIDTGSGAPYVFALSKSTVQFDFGGAQVAPIEFSDDVVDTDEDEIEAFQVGGAFQAARRESALIRAWNGATSMRSSSSLLFRDLRVLPGEGEITIDVEAVDLDCTVYVRRTRTPSHFRYYLAGTAPVLNSRRVADAILSDFAEEAGEIPSPSSLICAMIKAADFVQRDPEWLAAPPARRHHGLHRG